LIRVTHHALVYYRFALWPEVKHGIFTRYGGVSAGPWSSLNVGGTVGDDVEAVRQNHELMYDALNVNRARACTVWQVHGADTVIVDRPVQGRRWVAQADGMVTDKADTPLVMRYADCAPIMFCDPVRGVIGVAHAGWRGTVAGMASSMVETMTRAYGCQPADIQAAIGPSIGPERYQVGEEVVAAVQEHFGTTDDLVRRNPDDGSAYLDLWAANRLDLERAGVEQIEIAGICTASNTDEFFSHRAENGRTGRFGTVISL
jgi:polyphenol oxidase